MADFCKQCSIEIFGKDFGDMKGLCEQGYYTTVLCEDCGPVQVDHTGKCVSVDCDKAHGKPKITLHEEQD